MLVFTFSHHVIKIQTKECSILLRFYFYEVLEQLLSKFMQIFTSEGFFVL